jgi:hypothetical protein
MTGIPTAIGETSQRELERRGEGVELKEKQRRAPPTGRDIQPFLLEYVGNFVQIAAGEKFNPHVTIGVGTEIYLNKMLAEPFPAFTFSPAGASVYQLGSFGTARKELKALALRS